MHGGLVGALWVLTGLIGLRLAVVLEWRHRQRVLARADPTAAFLEFLARVRAACAQRFDG